MRLGISLLRIIAHILALLPLAVLIWDFVQGQLGVNPIREIQYRTGKYTLVLLVITLACTPVSMIPVFKWMSLLRRQLGLYAFTYASLHFFNFIGLDYGFNLRLLREDIFEKRYALVGFAAFLCLVPLAITSTKGWIRRLRRNWKSLHRLVYLSGFLAVVHFAWQAKADTIQPLVFGSIIILLLVVRILSGIRSTHMRSKNDVE